MSCKHPTMPTRKWRPEYGRQATCKRCGATWCLVRSFDFAVVDNPTAKVPDQQAVLAAVERMMSEDLAEAIAQERRRADANLTRLIQATTKAAKVIR